MVGAGDLRGLARYACIHWKKIVVHIDSTHWVLHLSLNSLTHFSWASRLMFDLLTQFCKIPGNWKFFQIPVAPVVTENHHSHVRIPMISFNNYVAKNIYSCCFIFCYQDVLYSLSCEYLSIHASNFLPLKNKVVFVHTIDENHHIWRPTRSPFQKIGDWQHNAYMPTIFLFYE